MALSDVCGDFVTEIEAAYERIGVNPIPEYPVPLEIVQQFKRNVDWYLQISGQPGACEYDPRIIAGIHRIVDACVLNRRWFYAIISLRMVDVFVGRCPDPRDTMTDDQLVNWLDATFNLMPSF